MPFYNEDDEDGEICQQFFYPHLACLGEKGEYDFVVNAKDGDGKEFTIERLLCRACASIMSDLCILRGFSYMCEPQFLIPLGLNEVSNVSKPAEPAED